MECQNCHKTCYKGRPSKPRKYCSHGCYWIAKVGTKCKPFTVEHRNKISIANKGKRMPKGKDSPLFGRPKTPEHCAKLSKARKGRFGGENHPQWKKDRSTLAKKQQRNDSAYKEWRKSVRDRDGWQCKIADGNCFGKIVAHHILPWAKFPELRYRVSNGITLCRHHHPRKRSEEMEKSPYFTGLVLKA